MSIYWGVLSHVERNISSLGVYVVDFDGQVAPYITGEQPLVGPQVFQSIEQLMASTPQHLGYRSLSPSKFNNDPMQVREAVYHHHAWAAIIINPNATALLRAAVSQANASYDPLGACQVVFVEARDQTTYPEYIFPELNLLQTDIVSKLGTMWTKMVMQDTSIPRSNLEAVPQALSPAIGFSSYNLRPFKPAGAIPTVNIGLIYLIIVAFFSFPFFMPIHMTFMNPSGHPPVRFWQTVAWRWVSAVSAYFFLSLAYSTLSLAFQIPFNNPSAPHTAVAQNPNAYGRATFPVYWMINWAGMSALGLACENVAMVVGAPWMALWLIFWVITNVSTGFYNLTLAPRFYGWGYAWPLHNSKSHLPPFANGCRWRPSEEQERTALTGVMAWRQSSKRPAAPSSTCIRASASTSPSSSPGAPSTPSCFHCPVSLCAGRRAGRAGSRSPREGTARSSLTSCDHEIVRILGLRAAHSPRICNCFLAPWGG